MAVHLQDGLYELCAKRLARDADWPGPVPASVDDALFDEYRLFQLRRTLRRVQEQSPFYRRRFAEYGVDAGSLNSLGELGKLPFTWPQDLSGTSYSLLCTSQRAVEKPVTFYSSGSTGLKKRIFFSSEDIGMILDFLPRGMNTVIDRHEARCQIFLQNTQGRGIGGMLAESLRRFGMDAWTSDLQDSAEDIFRLTRERGVNVWFGDAVTILRTTRLLSRRMDLRGLGMECLFLTMSNVPASMSESLSRAWGCRVSTHYGLTEAGWGLAVDCGPCGGYHYDELDHIIEIVDPETGRVLPRGEQGEVVLTNIARTCMPLIRYRTGDIASLHDSRCGSHLAVLGHIVRRREGAYVLNGRELWPAQFEEAIFRNEDVLDYRVFAESGRLCFELELAEPGSFDARAFAASLGCEPDPRIVALPCGALRPFCYEKKRIIEREAPE